EELSNTTSPSSQQKSLSLYRSLLSLAHDFVFTARIYGTIIITELSLSNSLKTIQPLSGLGTAGGTKYLHHGILFKFALDTYLPSRSCWMYGGASVPDD